MHVGVAGPACDRVVRQHEVVAVDVEITRRPDEGHDGEDQRQVRRDARVDAWRRSLEPEAPVQVVADRGDETLGDSGAADEPSDAAQNGATVSAAGDETTSDLPLGDVPGGTQFGTLVHEVLERVEV